MIQPEMSPEEIEINKAQHYNNSPAKCSQCGHPIECIDVVRHLGFLEGSAVKYLWRFLGKGAPVKDLKKAAYYIQRLIENLEANPS